MFLPISFYVCVYICIYYIKSCIWLFQINFIVIAVVRNTDKNILLNVLIGKGKLKFHSYPQEIMGIVLIRKPPKSPT